MLIVLAVLCRSVSPSLANLSVSFSIPPPPSLVPQDNWILGAGPLSAEQYDNCVLHPSSAAASSSAGTTYSRKAGTLTRCAFDLAPQHEAVKAMFGISTPGKAPAVEPVALYLQSKTAKLFVAVSLDDAIALAVATGASRNNSVVAFRRDSGAKGSRSRASSLDSLE